MVEEITQEKSFRLYWLDGSTEVIKGVSIEKAFTNHGYGAGAIRALDFFNNGEEQKYHWDEELKEWVSQNGFDKKSYSEIANLQY